MPASRARIEDYERRILGYDRRTPARDLAAARRQAAGRAHPPRGRGRVQRAQVRVRRVLVAAALLLLAGTAVSFGSAMLRPSNSGFGVQAVEWLRDSGDAWLVSDVESIYYSFSAPATGGPALRQLPRVGDTSLRAHAGYVPPPITPMITPRLPGEGVWKGSGPIVHGAPGVMLTTFRPDPNYPQLVAGVAWVDASRAWLQLYPGRYEPANSGNPPAAVPPSLRSGLLATFNSGFKLEDDGGGFVAFGHTYAPLKDGQATLLRYRDGTADVRAWTGGPSPGPSVEFARQNLPLIVSGGQLNPNLGDGPQWGATLGNAVRVWRSGVGVDARGDIIYAAADAQTAASLAQILQRAGAVRAMELDINSEWVTFNSYGAFGAVSPQKLLPDMTRDATRYLTPDDRDFLAVYARRG